MLDMIAWTDIILRFFENYAGCRLQGMVRLRGQTVKTPPFHGGIMGSNPVGVIFGSVAQLVRATGS